MNIFLPIYLLLCFAYILTSNHAFAQIDVEFDEPTEQPEINFDSTRPTQTELNRISDLAEKFLAGTITSEERAELEASGTNINMLESQRPTIQNQVPALSEQMVTADTVTNGEISSLQTTVYALILVNTLLVILFSMYIWRRRKITSVMDPM